MKRAAEELQDVIERHNRHARSPVDPSLNDVLYVVLRIAADVRVDPRFKGGWSDLVREVRRRLMAQLNMTPEGKNEPENSENSEI